MLVPRTLQPLGVLQELLFLRIEGADDEPDERPRQNVQSLFGLLVKGPAPDEGGQVPRTGHSTVLPRELHGVIEKVAVAMCHLAARLEASEHDAKKRRGHGLDGEDARLRQAPLVNEFLISAALGAAVPARAVTGFNFVRLPQTT